MRGECVVRASIICHLHLRALRFSVGAEGANRAGDGEGAEGVAGGVEVSGPTTPSSTYPDATRLVSEHARPAQSTIIPTSNSTSRRIRNQLQHDNLSHRFVYASVSWIQ
ncbi:hypothetical protein PISMIDRAFT_688249 [Pisolithus microcarpus 441]|uniref:Uncharacterized protein n=1 Tax=Pisolithus microcarpus 441 TaxID=765257 RepID=A0A0C9YB21_9AGAM|nr:hypothetical protein PISMIDRAFT_688249 [Pisolithus microcarpus 441]